MEIVLTKKNYFGATLNFVSIDLNRLFKCRDAGPYDSSTYNWNILNIYRCGISNYNGKGKYYEKSYCDPYSKSRAINHKEDALFNAIQEVGPENCKCNILVGISDEEARACEALLLYLDNRDRMAYGKDRWSGEWLLNKKSEDIDMELINKYFDLDGNNYIETFRRKMYHY